MPHTPSSSNLTSNSSSRHILTPSSKKGRNRKKSLITIPLPTTAQLLDQTQQTTDEWYKSQRTRKGYANYVKNGKEWLAGWASGEQYEEDLEDGRLRVELATAFEKIGEQTPVALRLFTAFKCEHQGCGFSTAEGLRSAFKDYFER